MNNQIWVVVANGSAARIYRGGPNSHPLEQIETFEHPQTRVHGRDLVTSKPGRSYDSAGGARHSYEPELTPQRNEANHFAHELAHHLEHSRRAGVCSKLYLIASPSFLGMLRSVLHATTRDIIALEVDKDITSKSAEEIRTYLPFRL